MKRDEIIDLIVRQLARKDPIRFGAAQDAAPGERGLALVGLVVEAVDEALGAVGEDASRQQILRECWFLVARQAELLTHLSAYFLRLAALEPASTQDSAVQPVKTQEDVETAMTAYIQALRQMKAVAAPLSLNPASLPTGRTVVEELADLPEVFAFLAARRSQLRALVHATGGRHQLRDCQHMGADRADEALSMYNTLVVGVDLAEAPENWSCRTSPQHTRQNIHDLLVDMMHLAKADGLDWEQLLAEARVTYEEERADDAREGEV